MGQWRLAKERGIFLLDITAKSGVKAFAPDYATVMQYKREEVSEDAYTKLYLERMADSRQRYPIRWSCLEHREELALACYCKAGVFCHRHLFKTLMQQYLEEKGHSVLQMGELQK